MQRKRSKIAGKRPSVKTIAPPPVLPGQAQVGRWLAFFLFGFAFLLYANTLEHGYAFDDAVAISENKFTQKGLAGIPDLLTKDFFAGIYGQALELGGGRWRPLSLITFAAEYEMFGFQPEISHLINVLLYALTAVLLLGMLNRTTGSLLFAFVCTLLWTAHPIHTEVVANIKSRDEILAFLGLIIVLDQVIRYLGDEKKSRLVTAAVAYFLSLLSKENGITFLAIIPLFAWFFTTAAAKRIIRVTLVFLVPALIYVGIRTYLVGFIGDRTNHDIMENPFVGTTFMERMATISRISGKYLGVLFYPHPLSSDYSYNEIPVVNWSSLSAIFPALIYAGLILFASLHIRKKNNWKGTVSFGISFYLITYSIVSNVVFNIGAPMGERFLYLPSLGFCMAITAAILKLLKAETGPLKLTLRLAFPVGIVLALFSWKVIARNTDWKNNLTLFSADVKNAPHSAKVHYYYANSLLKEAMKEKEEQRKRALLLQSRDEFARSVEINPDFHHSHYNLGLIYNELGQADSALASLNRVLELQPMHILSQGLLGSVYGKLKGDYDRAMVHLKKAVEYNPQDAGALENLGICYAMKGKPDSALVIFTQALQINTANAKMYLNIGITYQNLGDKQKADSCFARAFALDPSLKPAGQ